MMAMTLTAARSWAQADARTLVELFSAAGLIGGTIEYAEMIKRRASARRQAASQAESAEVGLRGLSRVMLADEPSDARSDTE
jgi:hypothetical protein